MLLILSMTAILSCSSAKIKRAENFYDKWEKTSSPISDSDYDKFNLIEKRVYDVYEKMILEISKKKPENGYPNLKYLIIEPIVIVSICDTIIKDPKQNQPWLKYKIVNEHQSIQYILKPRSNSFYKLLYYTSEYKEILKKRNNFSAPSVYGFKNSKKAFAIFGGRLVYPIGKMHYNSPLFRINTIILSKNLNEGIIKTSTEFSDNEYYFQYDEKTKSWFYDLFYELLE